MVCKYHKSIFLHKHKHNKHVKQYQYTLMHCFGVSRDTQLKIVTVWLKTPGKTNKLHRSGNDVCAPHYVKFDTGMILYIWQSSASYNHTFQRPEKPCIVLPILRGCYNISVL